MKEKQIPWDAIEDEMKQLLLKLNELGDIKVHDGCIEELSSNEVGDILEWISNIDKLKFYEYVSQDPENMIFRMAKLNLDVCKNNFELIIGFCFPDGKSTRPITVYIQTAVQLLSSALLSVNQHGYTMLLNKAIYNTGCSEGINNYLKALNES